MIDLPVHWYARCDPIRRKETIYHSGLEENLESGDQVVGVMRISRSRNKLEKRRPTQTYGYVMLKRWGLGDFWGRIQPRFTYPAAPAGAATTDCSAKSGPDQRPKS